MADNESPIDFGYIVEGTVERDPATMHCVIRTVDPQGAPLVFDLNRALANYLGTEVRVILTSFDTIQRLESMVGSGDMGADIKLGKGT